MKPKIRHFLNGLVVFCLFTSASSLAENGAGPGPGTPQGNQEQAARNRAENLLLAQYLQELPSLLLHENPLEALKIILKALLIGKNHQPAPLLTYYR